MDGASAQDTPPPSRFSSPRPAPDDEAARPKTQPDKFKRHAQFWFDDGNFTLLADDTLFKLHKSLLLRASPSTFHDALALGGRSASGEGTDEWPLLLPQITRDEFDVFCRALYPRWGDDEKFTTTELVQLMGLTDRLGAHAIFARAVAKLGKKQLSLVDRIAYAQRFDIDDWAAPAFVTLAQTLKTLSDDEAAKIGWDAAFRIATAQKALLASRLARVHNVNHSGCCNSCQSYVRQAVGPVGILLCSAAPNNRAASEGDQGFLDYLCAELKSRIPSVGSCGQQNCQSWPTAAHVKAWFDFGKEEKMIMKIVGGRP